ncbi:hypothetical protein [Microbacterium sp.]|uniref:hypothetical protein n=1 Tax=Microbacterium sp. TaxID=51671 RepID=UPI00356133D5
MTKKEAPGMQAEGFENTPTPDQEKEMNDTSMTETTDNCEAVKRLFAEIAECPEGHFVILTLEDPFFQDPQPVRVKRAAELDGLEVGEFVHLAPIFDADGRKLDEPGDEWWKAALADVDFDTWRSWRITPNAALRLGDVVAVSLGEYQFERTLLVDGVEVAELITLDEIRRRSDAQKDAWIAEHAEAIEAARPAEATSVDVWDFNPRSNGQGILYVREFGPVSLSWSADVVDGVVSFRAGVDVMVHVGTTSEVVPGVDEMRELASALMAAIPTVEAATA